MNEIIQDILLDFPDANQKKIELLINKAIFQIKTYLNKDFSDNQVIDKFKFAIEQIVLDTYAYQNSEQFKNNISKKQQGVRTIEYKTLSSNGRVIFSDEVKSMLPIPYVSLMG